MDRGTFEVIKGIEGKRVVGDIRFVQRDQLRPWLMATDIRIESDGETDLRMNINYNRESGALTINVVEAGVGPICRLDVNGQNHGAVGRTHKHELQDERCQQGARNLPTAFARPDFVGLGIREVWFRFCEIAKIEHLGNFEWPDGSEGPGQGA